MDSLTIEYYSKRNEELYTKIGDFFPFAVGKETKKTMASVLLGGIL